MPSFWGAYFQKFISFTDSDYVFGTNNTLERNKIIKKCNRDNEMDFIDVVERYVTIKVDDYVLIEKEGLRNKIQSDLLYDNCIAELKKSVTEEIGRILAYEYADYFQANNIKETDVFKQEFYEVILSKEKVKEFDLKYTAYKTIATRKLQNLIAYQEEIIDHFEENRSSIEDVFSNEFGNMIAIESGLGDLHDGKSVALITFECGELIYKPRGESNIEFLKMLLSLLTDQELCDFKFVKYFAMEDFSFEEVVDTAVCSNLEEIKEYYYRAGVMLAAFYFLDSFDMHHENIFCCGSYPVIIDFETMSKSPLDDERELDKKNGKISVLNTSFIPFVSDDSIFDINISALFSEKGDSKKIQQVLAEDENHNLVYKNMNIHVIEEKNVVRLEDGKGLEDCEAQEQLLKGFCDACYVVLKNKEHFIRAMQIYFETHNVVCRQLLRSTQVYFRFISASLHPKALQDENTRDDIFSILTKNFVASKFGYLRVNHEINQMKKCNIPLYYSKTHSRHLYSDGEIVCKNYFRESPDTSIINKINNFDKDLLEYQIELIKKSIALVQREEDFGLVYLKNPVENTELSAIQLKENVKYWVDYIKKMEFKIGENSSSMLSLSISKNDRLFSLGSINYILYEYGMYPLFMLYYGHLNNDNEIEQVGIRLAETFVQHFISLKGMRKDKRNYNLSVFTGIGSLIYLVLNFYQVTEKNKYYEKAFEISDFILDEIIGLEEIEPKEYIYLDGFCSSVYLITKMVSGNNNAVLSKKVNRVIDKLISNYDLVNYESVGFAHGLSGTAVMFSEFFKYTKDKKILDNICKIMEKENRLIRNGGSDQDKYFTWCNGSSGLLLARKIIGKNTDEKISNGHDYDMVLKNESFYIMDNLCVCHGTYGNLEIANWCLRNFRDDFSKDESFIRSMIRKKYFNSFSDIQWIKDFDYEFEHFMLGNMGIAYVMMELCNDKVPSILALELYERDHVCK